MSKPSHIAYIVEPAKEGSGKKDFWRAVGAIWPHENGNGFDLIEFSGVGYDGISR